MNGSDLMLTYRNKIARQWNKIGFCHQRKLRNYIRLLHVLIEQIPKTIVKIPAAKAASKKDESSSSDEDSSEEEKPAAKRACGAKRSLPEMSSTMASMKPMSSRPASMAGPQQ